MMKDRLSIQRDRKGGGYYVVIDGATERYDEWAKAVKSVCEELGMYDELISMQSDLEQNLEAVSVAMVKTTAQRDRLKRSLGSAADEFEKLRAELEKEKTEKNRYLLEAYDLRMDLVKLARLMARKC